LKVIDLAIDLPSEEASVSYPECTCELLCILGATVYPVSYCALIGTRLAAFEQGLSMSLWMQTESAGVSTMWE